MNGQYNPGDIVLHNWKLIRPIGEGSFGRVFEAQREDFGRIYKAALKIITIPQNKSEIQSILADGMDEDSATTYFRSFVEELVDEFSLMAQLKGNSNIVSYEDHKVIQHTVGIGWDIIIRMELLTPLLQYASGRTMHRKDIMKLGMDICRALELCQKYNIVHRDIKPENIFVSDNGDFKLGDFGIARTVEKTTSGLSKKGTYTYMAPEVYRGEAYGSSVDIYSLGIVLYRILNNNRAPFFPDYPITITHRDRESALAKRIGGVQFPIPKNADGRLAEIVMKACAYNPKFRFSSPMQMREELEAILYYSEEAAVIYPRGDEVPINPDGSNGPSKPRQKHTQSDSTVGLFANVIEETELVSTNQKSLTQEGTVSLFSDTTMPNLTTCINCGANVPKDAGFCVNCGAVIGQQSQPAQPVNQPCTNQTKHEQPPFEQQSRTSAIPPPFVQQSRASAIPPPYVQQSRASAIQPLFTSSNNHPPLTKPIKKAGNVAKIAMISGAAVLLVIVVSIILLLWPSKDTDSQQNQSVTIPRFINRRIDEIENDDEYKEKYDFNITYENNNEYDIGIIFYQNPSADRQQQVLKSGNKINIDLIVSGGEELLHVMPNLVGKHYSDAINQLRRLNLELNIIEESVISEVAKGYVVETRPSADGMIAKGNTVVIIRSAGEQARKEIVPDLKGSSKDVLEKAFRDIDLIPDFREIDGDEPIGTVLIISKVGQEVEVPQTIIVYLSKGPSIIETPSVSQPNAQKSKVQLVMITYDKKENNDFAIKVGESVLLGVKIEPIETKEEITWASSDPEAFEVVALNAEGTQAKVTGLKKGTATLTVTVGGVTDDCIVRVMNR